MINLPPVMPPKPKFAYQDFFALWKGLLFDPFSFGSLPRNQEGLDELSFTANDHTSKALIPFARWHIRFLVEPCRQQFKLPRIDFAFLDTVKQMLKERRRQVVPADFRHDLDSVEAASDLFPQCICLFRVLCGGQFFGQQRKLSGT